MESQNSAFSVFGSICSNVSDALLTLLYPQACQICERAVESKIDGAICGECWQATHIFKGKEIVCHKCSRFLKHGVADVEVFCHQCETDDYDLTRSVGFYEKALAVAVLNLKKKPFLPVKLQNLICESFDNSIFKDADLIVPVPLSVRRLRERGFNQSALIARLVAGHANLPLDEISLQRTVHTEKHRAGMDGKSRAESVSEAFAVKRPRLVKGKKVLLIDDVFTSGATVSNCAKALKESNAEKVYVFTIARAS